MNEARYELTDDDLNDAMDLAREKLAGIRAGAKAGFRIIMKNTDVTCKINFAQNAEDRNDIVLYDYICAKQTSHNEREGVSRFWPYGYVALE